MSASFSPSPQELAIVSQVFAHADPNRLGVITGDAAIKIFAGTSLPPVVLGEIWDIADAENKGWLPKKGVAVAVRLIGWAQKGEKMSVDLLNKPGPLPIIEGITSVAKQHTGISLPRSPPPTALPPLTPQDKAKFQRLFASCGPVNGLVSGDKARDVFVKSKLSLEQLSQIWSLADTQDRGSLDLTDFTIGMYLIQAAMSGELLFIPNSLPPGLYEQASSVPQVAQTTGTSGSFSPTVSHALPQHRNTLSAQYTGQSQTAAAPRLPSRTVPSSLGNTAFPSFPVDGYTPAWDVTAAEKAAADRFFDGLDKYKRGYIEGDVAVPFMLDSKLSGDDLARIWDLADINSDGRLTRDAFAVAMHLIYSKRAGNELPVTLPPSLVPPSLRQNGVVPSSPLRAEPQVDLFTWDDTPPASATQPIGSVVTTQPAVVLPFTSSLSKPSAVSDPFATTSNASVHNSQKHLLDDDETSTPAAPLQDKSAEIGNMKNQLTSTNRSLESTKTERMSVEQMVSAQTAQLSGLQTQLSSAKAAYETETTLLAALRERWTGQNADIQKASHELIRAESDLSAVRVEKAEVEGSFLRDKEEARELHRKMFEIAQQTDATKAEVEKIKKEAKQQKGLLAIARKQLSVKEAEHAKMAKELEEAKAEHQATVREREAAEAELERLSSLPPPTANEPPSTDGATTSEAASSQVQPSTPTPSSPSSANASLSKSNNPFERLAMASGMSTPSSQSPFLPFANSSVATPPVGGLPETEAENTASGDPFGFDQAFTTEKPVTNVQKVQQNGSGTLPGTTSSTPKPIKANITLPLLAEPSPASPITDTSDTEYVTPPTTSGSFASATSPAPNAAMVFPDLSDPASEFPALDAEGHTDLSNSEVVKKAHNGDELAYGARLMELKAEESESDSDEDEVPLGELKKQQAGKVEGATVPPGPSFDDIFVQPLAPMSTGPLPTIGAIKTDLVVTTADWPVNDLTPKSAAPPSSGVNAFDEAMGKISGNGSASAVPKLTFDSAFDAAFEDNFDFASAAEASFPPVPAPVPVDVKTSASPVSLKPERFDDIFGVPLATSPAIGASAPLSLFTPDNNAASASVAQVDPAQARKGVSFEDPALGFQPPKPSSELDASLSSKASAAALTLNDSPNTKSTESQPVSPEGSPTTSRMRPASPPPPQQQQVSSPPRVASPKARSSTSSSKDGAHDKPKDPPPRHSKLSLRLPFGRRKNKHQDSVPPPLPPAQQHDQTGIDEDVGAVKQLCSMGFSREQAVVALERNDYNLGKAINSLLGTDGRVN